MCGVFLAGCTFTDKTESVSADNDELIIAAGADTSETDVQNEQEGNDPEERRVNDNLEVPDPNQSSDTTGVIYNGVKYYNGRFYYSDPDGFKRIDKDMSTPETLAEGNVRVGNCADNYIYYIRYPADDEQNAGVFRMNLSDLAEEQLLAWSEDMWMIQNIFASQNIVYLEKYNICEAYEVNAGQINQIDEKDNVIYQNMDNCHISYEDINELVYGYSNIMLLYHKVVYVDRKNNKVIVYDADSGLLYDMAENDNKFVNYGTYDNQYIYMAFMKTTMNVRWSRSCGMEDAQLAGYLKM